MKILVQKKNFTTNQFEIPTIYTIGNWALYFIRLVYIQSLFYIRLELLIAFL